MSPERRKLLRNAKVQRDQSRSTLCNKVTLKPQYFQPVTESEVERNISERQSESVPHTAVRSGLQNTRYTTGDCEQSLHTLLSNCVKKGPVS